MTKYKRGNVIAPYPDKDLVIFKRMSSLGYHLRSSRFGTFWVFEEGAPEDYDYRIILDDDLSHNELMEMQRHGWLMIVHRHGYRIFRAPAGAPGMHLEPNHYYRTMQIQQLSTYRISILSLLMIGLLVYILRVYSQFRLSFYFTIAVIAIVFCFNFIPFISFTDTLWKLKRSSPSSNQLK